MDAMPPDVDRLKASLRSEVNCMRSTLEGILQAHLHKQERLIEDFVAAQANEPTTIDVEKETETIDTTDTSSMPRQASMGRQTSFMSEATGYSDSDILVNQRDRPQGRMYSKHSALQLEHLQRSPSIASSGVGGRKCIRRGSSSSKLDSRMSPSWVAELGLDRSLEQSRMVRCIDWCLSLREPPRAGLLYNFVYSKSFSALCTLVIFANAVFEVYATDFELSQITEDQAPADDSIFWAMESGFLAFYAIELILKMSLHKLYFFINADFRWNIFDMCLVLFTMYGQWITPLIGGGGDTDLTFMRSVRVLKMAKVLRIVRVFRFIAELRLIMNSVIGSMLSLFWSFVGLLFIFYVFGLVFVQGVLSHLRDDGNDLDPNLGSKFGSVQQTMLSLYMAASGGADWKIFYDAIKVTGARYGLLFLVFMLFIQIAVMNIVTGIFVENAMKLAKPDREAQAVQQRKKDQSVTRDLRKLCEDIDTEKSGAICMDAFMRAYSEMPKLRDHMAVLGLDIHDAQTFFGFLSSVHDSQQVDIDSFVACCMKLRGTAKGMDLHNLQHQTLVIYKTQQEFNEQCASRLDMLVDLATATMGTLAEPIPTEPLTAMSDGQMPNHAMKAGRGTASRP
mmetsp:Transcript_75920/g.171748  ORF Transcript_75920/g.171748 Transcript_75920/m.171748 type:complete len:620 (+) Transcript_75920:39-1898(+)